MSQPSRLSAGARYIGPHDPQADVDVTVVFRHASAPQPGQWPHAAISRDAYWQTHGADPAAVERLREYGRKHGMRETGCQMARRTLHWRGSAQSMRDAFGTDLGQYEMPGGERFVGCTKAPELPDPSVIAVLGLDRRPVARPHFRRPLAQPSSTYTPLQLGELYQFPADTDGSGQTIAIIELGGGYSQADLDTYFSGLGIATPSVTSVSVDGGTNQTGSDADGEVMLDIEVAGALAPAAKLVVYFATNTDKGFYEAISQAAHDSDDKTTVISISWGGPEDGWSAQARDAMQSALQDAAALGVTVTVAAGDSGFDDGEGDGQPHVDFPASSPYVLACGGTKLLTNASTITSEVVWNETTAGEGATGGGVSTVFALPSWQTSSSVPSAAGGFAGRGVPDVSGDADPLTGYQVRVDGQNEVIGGTSAVAPLWAALLARLNQSLGTPLGDAHAAFYQVGSKAFRDISQGDNGKYAAAAGWDACTGLGSPNGSALLDALKALSKGAS
jgi:kumamolisin